MPDVIQAAINCERFGAEGITVHPRPDERHIRYNDVRNLAKVLTTEFNIEGYPSKEFIALVTEVHPAQVTLVPDPPTALTSNAGWDTKNNKVFLTDIVKVFKEEGIRVSLFIGPLVEMVGHAFDTGADRIELYTEAYAAGYEADKEKAIAPYYAAAMEAGKFGLGVNAGHDLNLKNLNYFYKNIGNLAEVSIGHALISDALYFGLENTIQLYLRELK